MSFIRAFLTALPIIVLVFCVELENPVQAAQEEDYEYADIENSTLLLVNQHRASMIPERPWLTLHNTIIREARKHSQEMAEGIVVVGHDGFSDRCDAIGRVLSVRAVGENVATNYGYSDPAWTAVTGWLQSPGHKANIEKDFTLTGVGVAKSARGEYFFTQIFVKTK